MARVTVEDCVEIIPNRFELVLLAARRAREISAGSAITINKDNDKNPVIALREIAEKTIHTGTLRENIIRSLQRVVFHDVADEDLENDFLDALSNTALNMSDDEEDDEEDFLASQMSQADAEAALTIMEEEA